MATKTATKAAKTTGRTELEKAIERVDASDALAKIAAESQKPRVLIWKSSDKPETWSRYAVKENDLKLGFAESFDQAMKRAKNKFPASRVDHDPKMTDKLAKGLKKKFEATITAAGGTVQGAPTETIKSKTGKGPGKAPKEETPDKSEQIEDLLEELRAATDPDDKKKIRRKLRARGHYGGLGERVTAKTGPKPAGTKKPAKQEEPDDEDEELDLDDED